MTTITSFIGGKNADLYRDVYGHYDNLPDADSIVRAGTCLFMTSTWGWAESGPTEMRPACVMTSEDLTIVQALQALFDAYADALPEGAKPREYFFEGVTTHPNGMVEIAWGT